jgi:hypothetical protein
LVLVGEFVNFASPPIEQSNIVLRALLGLVGESNGAAIVRPVWILFANRRRVGQVDHLAAFARRRVNVPELVARVVLLLDDPFAVRRPDGVVLPVVRLRQLDWPSP